MVFNDEKSELNKALKIGSVCIISYMLSYYMRNILSVTTPEMLENGDFTKEFIAAMSSVYMIVYASGQLVNGIIGDIIKPRYMVLSGFFLYFCDLTWYAPRFSPCSGGPGRTDSPPGRRRR